MKKVTVLVGPGRTKRPKATFGPARLSAQQRATQRPARLGIFFSRAGVSRPRCLFSAQPDGTRWRRLLAGRNLGRLGQRGPKPPPAWAHFGPAAVRRPICGRGDPTVARADRTYKAASAGQNPNPSPHSRRRLLSLLSAFALSCAPHGSRAAAGELHLTAAELPPASVSPDSSRSRLPLQPTPRPTAAEPPQQPALHSAAGEKEAAPPRALSPERALLLVSERASVEGMRVGALSSHAHVVSWLVCPPRRPW